MSSSIVRRTKSCPCCNQLYYINENKTLWPKDELVRFGRLFMTCPNCGHTFRDTDIYELAVMDPPQEHLPADYLRMFHADTLFTAAVCIAATILFYATDDPRAPMAALIFAFVGGIYAVTDFLRYRSHLDTIEAERKKSVDRLKRDPEYAHMLKKAGYAVPAEYLKTEE